MNDNFEMIAKTFYGLEEVLAEELINLGANDVQIGRRMVAFSGDKKMLYKANFCLRTAIRILKPILKFEAKNADEVYKKVYDFDWSKFLDVDKSFAIDAVVFSNEFSHSKFVSYKVKDAIVDHFRDIDGKRPSVRINKPDVFLNIHIAETKCTLSLDSSGESLHRRGYRQEAVEAPLNEVLAAGMILMTGWRGETDLIDPMCGSGTIPIEAALIARNIAPGVFHKEFAFERWVDFDQNIFDAIYNDDSEEREFEHKIYAYDNSPQAIEIATHNIQSASVSKEIILLQRPIQQFEQPKQKAILITNPPYGERISTNDILGLYHVIGERLKHAFAGSEAWILAYREDCMDQIGLRPSKTVELFNGSLDCQFRRYELFDGKMKIRKIREIEASGENAEDKLMERERMTQERGVIKKERTDSYRKRLENGEDPKRDDKERGDKRGEKRSYGRDSRSDDRRGEKRSYGSDSRSDDRRGEKRSYGSDSRSDDRRGDFKRSDNQREDSSYRSPSGKDTIKDIYRKIKETKNALNDEKNDED
ncbi:MAG: THUMP domain-containing protein [Bacteroidaceae bacterium]